MTGVTSYPLPSFFQLCYCMHSKSSWMSSNLFSLIYKEVIHRFLLGENGEPKVRRLIRVHIVLQFKGQKPLNHWFGYDVKTQFCYKYPKWHLQSEFKFVLTDFRRKIVFTLQFMNFSDFFYPKWPCIQGTFLLVCVTWESNLWHLRC